MSRKRALITGITGQDGSYLSELLVDKGYEVYGLARRSSRDISEPIEKLRLQKKVTVIHGDIRDTESIKHSLGIAKPDELYNLASQSHVGISFDCTEETMAVNYHAAESLFNEALSVNSKVKIYQASSSEMFGNAAHPQNESTAFHPINPYGISKLLAYQKCVLENRIKRNAFVCSGILYNHESPRRGKNFITRKITHSLVKIKLGLQDTLEVGNINSKRDWGYAKDYVEAMWQMMQQTDPDDFVIATGLLHSVKDIIDTTARNLDINLNWVGKGVNTQALNNAGKVIVKINPEFYRPIDATNLVGDSTKARNTLGWAPSIDFEELISLMVQSDLNELKKHA